MTPQDWQKSLDEKLVVSLSKSRLPSFRQLRLLPYFLNKGEKKLIRLFSLGIFICLIILSISFYLQHTQAMPKNGGNYVEGLVGLPKYINPLLAQYNDVDQDISKLVFNGLMKIDNQGNTQPDLVKEYQVSPDQKTYTLKLRDNIYWHDGEKLTSADIEFTFQSLMDPDWQSPWRAYFENTDFEVIDDSTVRFTLNGNVENFMEYLTFGIIPMHLWQNIPASAANMAELNKKPIGTGPYKFDSLTKDKSGNIRSIKLVKNPNYFQRPAYINDITFKFYGDFETATEALKNNNIEGLGLLPNEYKEKLNNNKNLVFYNLSLPQYAAVFFNTNANDSLKSKNVRQALSYAVDKQKILSEVMENKGQLINGPILPGFIGYNADLKKYDFNLDQARQLLDTDGWKLTADQNSPRKKGDKTLQIKLTTVDKIEYINAAKIIQANWQAIGVQADLEIIPKDRIKKDVIDTRNYNALLFGEIIKNDPYPFWHSSQTQSPGTNLAVWSNRDVDKYLEEARSTSDLKIKDEKLKDFQATLVEEAPAIFLYNPVHLYPVDNKIKGINTLSIYTPSDRFQNITDWYIKSSRKWK
jgi:peptide/nickel transport system substrate-binding protein